jgi:Flp pilus assembly protein TadD
VLGLAALEQGRYDEAIRHLEAAAELNPHRRSIAENLERARSAG